MAAMRVSKIEPAKEGSPVRASITRLRSWGRSQSLAASARIYQKLSYQGGLALQRYIHDGRVPPQASSGFANCHRTRGIERPVGVHH